MSVSKKRKMELSSPQEVIEKFHNLEGDLICERKKSFFTLLKAASEKLTPTEIDYVIDNLNPKSYQQKLFYVYALVQFKKIEHLLKILKDCNKEHIKIVIQQKWFIQEAFKDITPKTLVNEFFPEVSYSTRLKLLWRIPYYWSEEKNDELFSCVQQRYGFCIASNVLQACSTTTIEKILDEHKTALTPTQVIYLLNRNIHLFSMYINHWESIHKKPYKEKPVISLLACKYPEVYLQLEHNKKICSEKLKPAASNSVIRSVKQELCNDAHRFDKILNTRRLVKSLGSEFQTFCIRMMPSKFEDFNEKSPCFRLLKHFPKKARWGLFTQLLTSVFPHKSIENFLEIIDNTILQLNPGKEIIYLWAKIKFENNSDPDFLQYYPSSESIPVIKEMINLCSDMRKRQALIKLLISTCAHNNDLVSLDKVLKYIVSRHKNEEPHAYMRQIQFLMEAFKHEEFTKEHWNFIQQQLTLMRAKDGVHYSEYMNVEVPFLEYAYKNDRDAFKSEAIAFLKRACDNSWNFKRDFESSTLKYEFFLEITSLFLKEIPSTVEYYNEVKASLIFDLIDLSKLNPEKCINISDYPDFISSIEATFAKGKTLNYSDLNVITSVLTYNIEFPQYALTFLTESKVVETLKNVEHIYTIWTFMDFLVSKKNLPEFGKNILVSLIDHFEEGGWELRQLFKPLLLRSPKIVLEYINKIGYSMDFYKELKQYSHLDLDKKICDFFISDWSKTTDERKMTALTILMQLLEFDEFVKFYCDQLKVTLSKNENADGIGINTIKKHTLLSFKKVVVPEKYIPILLELCDGNFSEDALPALNSLFARSPEKYLYSYIESMSKQNIQSQENSLILSNQFLEQNCVLNLLNNISPTSYGTLKFICLFALKLFVKTESEDVLNLFINLTDKFTECDRQIFSSFVRMKVSKKYAPRYIEICWRMIERFMEQKKKSHRFLDKLLEVTLEEEIVKSLSSTFVKHIITKYFTENGDKRLSNVNFFVLFCLAHREEDKESNYKMMFDMLAKLSKENICLFCYNFVECQNKINQLAFVDTFIQHWKQNFPLKDTINEHIILNLLYKSMTLSKEDFSQNVVDYLEQLTSELDSYVHLVYSRNLYWMLNKTKQFNMYEILHLMLLYKPSSAIAMFVLNLLNPPNEEETEEIKAIYKSILGILKASGEPIVKCCYEQYVYKNECEL